MATNRTVYHIAPDSAGDRWVITQENDEAFREEHRTKEEAVTAARERARAQESSQVKVHKSDGDMEYENTYGDDPRQYPS